MVVVDEVAVATIAEVVAGVEEAVTITATPAVRKSMSLTRLPSPHFPELKEVKSLPPF